MTIDPCPSCEQPPVIVEDTGTLKLSIGCRQVFFRRREEDAECSYKFALMEIDLFAESAESRREEAICVWNRFTKSK